MIVAGLQQSRSLSMARIARVASKPFMTGMEMSIMTLISPLCLD
jgi:hypothetical protein